MSDAGEAPLLLRWPYPAPPLSVGVDAATRLLAPLGLSGRDSVASELLNLLGADIPLAQCTIFAFEANRAPQTIGVGDRSRTRSLPQIAQAYTRHYWRFDPVQAVMAAHQRDAAACPATQPLIILQRQSPEQLTHLRYRQSCYEAPEVAERVAVLSLHQQRRWLSIHLYRGREHGLLTPHEWLTVQAWAPLMVQAVRLHHDSALAHADLMPLMMERLRDRHPTLTERDLDVARALLQGLDRTELAKQLGLSVSSAPTYVKRLLRKLGLSGGRELVAWLLQAN